MARKLPPAGRSVSVHAAAPPPCGWVEVGWGLAKKPRLRGRTRWAKRPALKPVKNDIHYTMEKIDLKVKDRISQDFGRRIDSFEVIDKFPYNIFYIRISLGDLDESKSYQFEVNSKQYLCVADYILNKWIFKMGYWELWSDGKYHRFRP
jgi:hypothetical protein